MRDLDPARAAWIEGLARLAGAGPRGRTSAGRAGVGQCVDRDIGGYSPSLPLSLPADAPRHTVTVVSSARRGSGANCGITPWGRPPWAPPSGGTAAPRSAGW